jgi:hypothetical protein
MAEIRESARVAINVMRARITVVGFNIAIISFQIALLRQLSGGIKLPTIDTEILFQAFISLFMALALSIVALVLFIVSSALDREGICDHWTLLLGELFMYFGLAHSVAGFFGPFIGALGRAAADMPDLGAEMTSVRVAVTFAGGGAWMIATYLGPIVSLLRSPFSRSVTRALTGVYLVMLLSLAWVSGQTAHLEAAIAESEPWPMVVEFLQFLRW